jgi:hypothetical protein
MQTLLKKGRGHVFAPKLDCPYQDEIGMVERKEEAVEGISYCVQEGG